MHRYVIFGAGAQGVAAAWWLLRRKDTASVTITDMAMTKGLKRLTEKSRNRRLKVQFLTLLDQVDQAEAIMRDCDVAIGATTYEHNLALTQAAIRAKCHWVDFGHKISVRRAQEALHDLAVAADVAIADNQGIAPGWINVIAALVLRRLGGQADWLWQRVGGIPVRDVPPIGYGWVFAGDGLIHEMEAKAEVLINGRIVEVESLTGLPMGHIDFPEPFGRLWYVPTSNGSGAFFETHRGDIKEGGYTTLRRSASHWEFMIALRDLGFWNPAKVRLADGTEASPRAMTVAMLDSNLPRNVPDALVAAVVGRFGNAECRADLIAYSDPVSGHTAMQRCTAYGAAATAWLLASGEVTGRGSLRLERDFPIDRYLELMAESGLIVTETCTLDELPGLGS